MRAIIERTQLHRELGLIQTVIERRATIPILAYVRMDVTDGQVVFTGTDLDVSMRLGCEARETERGVVCLPARKLGEIVRVLPDEPVVFTGDEQRVTLSCGRARFRLAGLPVENFPEVPTFPAERGRSFPAAALGPATERVIFATSLEESRYTLSGVQMEWWDGGFRLVATDGHRLALVDSSSPSPERSACLIPRKTMQELLRLIEHAEEEEVRFAHDANHVYFQVGGRELISRLLTGQFPNYEMVIPKEHGARAVVEASVFREACRRVATLADERSRGITLSFSEGRLTLTARTAQGDEEAVEEMLCEYEGEPLVIAFNSEYLLDFFDVVREGMVEVELKDAQSPALWRPSADRYVYIVMPMRLM
ncbi:DNA polymerase III subunit beta [bacterium HR08]|nr:DNA polymerase III subunit beta [bacterium HR08]